MTVVNVVTVTVQSKAMEISNTTMINILIIVCIIFIAFNTNVASTFLRLLILFILTTMMLLKWRGCC